MSFLSNWAKKIQNFFVPGVSKTVEAVKVEVTAVEAQTKTVAKVKTVIKAETPKVKATTKKAAKKKKPTLKVEK